MSDLWPRGEKPVQALCGEDERLAVLAAYGTASLVEDPELAGLVSLVAEICETPIAMVTVVERERQLFLARLGIEETETPRPTSFCAHAMLGADALVVTDATQDPRFAGNPLVTGEPGVRFYAGQPLVSAEGAPLGALCVIDRVPRPEGLNERQSRALQTLAQAVMRRLASQRQREELDLEQSLAQERVQQVMDSFPGIAWSADDELRFDYFNAGWSEMVGAEAPTSVAKWASFIHPDDFARSSPAFIETLGRGEPFEDELRLRLASGEWRWMLSRVVPISTPDGDRRWVGTLFDIDREHRQREANDLLANELSHRIKNIFAVISGLIAIRSRGREEVAEFAQELSATIRALGTAHDYVRPVEGRSTDCLQGLLRDLLAPYHNGDAGRVAIGGDDVAIGARAATPLALIFHELATNSAKYGALSGDEGEVSVKIAASGESDGRIRVAWRETGIPPRDEQLAEHEGFGSRLLRLAIESQLRGEFTRSFTPNGILVEIAFPADRITG
ncbi:MAG: PAS domain-containing protein [Erythrobacter sp.]